MHTRQQQDVAAAHKQAAHKQAAATKTGRTCCPLRHWPLILSRCSNCATQYSSCSATKHVPERERQRSKPSQLLCRHTHSLPQASARPHEPYKRPSHPVQSTLPIRTQPLKPALEHAAKTSKSSTSPGIPRRSLIPVLIRPKQA